VPYEVEVAEFADLCHELCLRLLRLFALGLKVWYIPGNKTPHLNTNGYIMNRLTWQMVGMSGLLPGMTGKGARAGVFYDYFMSGYSYTPGYRV